MSTDYTSWWQWPFAIILFVLFAIWFFRNVL